MFANPFQALNSFFDNNNATRASAENYLKELALSSPNDSLDFYISILDIDNLKLVELAAVSIKKYHLDKSEYYEQIDENKFELLVEKIFALFKENNKTLKIYKRFIEILVLIYANNQGTFSHLTKSILDMQNTQSHIIQICIMYFIENICIQCFDEEDLQMIAPDLMIVFENFMQSPDKDVVIATVKAISSFLSSIEDKEISAQFNQIIPIILKLLIVTAKDNDDDTAISLVQALGELAESHPPLIKPFIEDTLEVLSEILITKSFSNNLRNQAIICVQILSRFCDVAVRRSQNLQAKVVPAYIQVLCEIDQQKSDGIFNDMEFSVVSKSEPCFVIQESLTKLASSLTPKVLFPYFMPFITQNIQSNVWSTSYASYICIGALAQGSSKFFMNELEQLMNYILTGFNSNDPRIIYISLVTIGILALEYSPNLQENFHKPIIEKILDVINDKTYIKLQVQALKTFLDFCKDILDDECKEDIFSPYGERLLGSLVNIIKNTFHTDSDILLQEALNAVSVLSSLLDQDFAEYYLDVMNILKEILANIANTNERRAQIRIETIECFGSMINTIRAESGFLTETDKIMEYFIKLAQGLDPSDLERSAILDVYCQVSSYLRYDFVKYMPYIFEDLLKLMETEIGLIPDKQQQGGAAQVYGLDVSALTTKISAINAIFVLSRNLGKSYYDFIKPTIRIVTKYFSHYSATISRKAFKTVKNLVLACENEQDVAGVLAECLPSMFEVLTTNVRQIHDVAKSKFVFKQVYKSIQALTGPLLQSELVVNLLNLMVDAVKLCQSENRELATKFEDLDDCDDEKQEEFQDDYNKNVEILRVIAQINEVLLKCFGTGVETELQTELVRQYFTVITNQSASITELQYSIEFFNIFLKLCSLNAFNNISADIVTHLVACCEKPVFQDIKENILSGFGIIAKRMERSTFKPIKNTFLNIILQTIDDPKAFNSENASCTDVAITALGKIALYQYELQDPQSEEIFSRFLKPLPLKDNYNEAQACHRMLLEEISNKSEFLTTQSQNLQNQLLQTIQIIKKVDDSSPEDEILDDFSRKLLCDILNNV